MQKILYLEHPQPDLNSYNIYRGLCQVLGEDRIVDFPYKKLYRGEAELYDSPYLNRIRSELIKGGKLPYGVPSFAPGEDLVSGWPDKVDFSYDAGPYIDPKMSSRPGQYPRVGLSTKGRDYTEDQIVKMIKNGEFSCIVLATSHRVPTIALARLRDAIGGLNKLPPIIYTDHGERDELNEHWAHVFNPVLIFKCILTEEQRTHLLNKYGWHHVYPLPNSNFMSDIDYEEHFHAPYFRYMGVLKYFDFYYQFMGHENRGEVINVMDRYCQKYGRAAFNRTGNYDLYLEILSATRIVITHRGTCKETLRYWDIPLFPTLMVCDGTMGAIHPNPFEDGKNAIFYKDDPITLEKELVDKCEYYINNEKERLRIAIAGMEHMRKYHTNKARAEWMLGVMRSRGITI